MKKKKTVTSTSSNYIHIRRGDEVTITIGGLTLKGKATRSYGTIGVEVVHRSDKFFEFDFATTEKALLARGASLGARQSGKSEEE